jgi:dolichol-phosphate mannosyltransferase
LVLTFRKITDIESLELEYIPSLNDKATIVIPVKNEERAISLVIDELIQEGYDKRGARELIQMEKRDVQGAPSMQVIIAALNEQEGIGLTIAELMRCLDAPKVLVVDGKSSDRTVEVAKNFGAEIVYQSGVGKGDALAKGFEYLDPAADYVVITDADYTYPAQAIPEMIRILEENPSVGMVCGNRFHEQNRISAFDNVYSFGNKLIALTHNLLNGITLEDPLTGLRVIRPSLLSNWQVKSKGFDVEVELNYYVERMGFTIVEVPIYYRQRVGEKKLKIQHGFSILKRVMLDAAIT